MHFSSVQFPNEFYAEQSAILACAHDMADAARAATLPYFRSQGLIADNKDRSGFDPVTAADKAAEQAMRDVLARLRSQDSIFGEGYGEIQGNSGLTWVLDPIDGTRAFISGLPTWGVLIAVGPDNGPSFGIIDQPYIGERFIGGFGRAECVGPHGTTSLATSDIQDLNEATLFTTFPEVGTFQDRAGFEAVAQQTKLTRYGIDCYAYALLAGGHVDLVIEAGLNAYDIQAPIAVIEAAGGVVTDWSGASAAQGGRVIAASNRELHAKTVEILSKF